MREQREYIRLHKSVLVSHRVAGSLLGACSMTRDISGGGLRFPTFQSLTPGAALNMDISLPGEKKPINALAQVVWQKEKAGVHTRFMMGMQFTRISEEDRIKIVDYVKVSCKHKSFLMEGSVV